MQLRVFLDQLYDFPIDVLFSLLQQLTSIWVSISRLLSLPTGPNALVFGSYRRKFNAISLRRWLLAPDPESLRLAGSLENVEMLIARQCIQRFQKSAEVTHIHGLTTRSLALTSRLIIRWAGNANRMTLLTSDEGQQDAHLIILLSMETTFLRLAVVGAKFSWGTPQIDPGGCRWFRDWLVSSAWMLA